MFGSAPDFSKLVRVIYLSGCRRGWTGQLKEKFMEERGGGRGSEEQEEEREDICTLLFTYICSYILQGTSPILPEVAECRSSRSKRLSKF